MGKKNRNNDPLLKKPGALADTIYKKSFATEKVRLGKKRKRNDDNEDDFVGGSESLKILKQARKQLNEITESENEVKKVISNNTKLLPSNEHGDSDEESGSKADQFHDATDRVDNDFNEELMLNFEKFMPESNLEKQKMADDLLEAIDNKKNELESRCSESSDVKTTQLSDELKELFKEVGKVMSAYRSGPVPKPFKIIPKYTIWEELLELTQPEKWSAAAIFAGTRVFVSNMKDNEAAKFMNRVLLPRIRDDIAEYKKLNDHLYNSLIKCMFKSYGFIKGFLLPLCKQADFFSKEATIIASVLEKSSIKMKHSAAAMMELSQMEYTPGVCIILTTLINKKYALPSIVLDSLKKFFTK